GDQGISLRMAPRFVFRFVVFRIFGIVAFVGRFGIFGAFAFVRSGVSTRTDRRISAGLSFFLYDLDRDPARTAEHYLVAVLKPHFALNARAVDGRAVAAVEVFYPVFILARFDLGVITRNIRIVRE